MVVELPVKKSEPEKDIAKARIIFENFFPSINFFFKVLLFDFFGKDFFKKSGILGNEAGMVKIGLTDFFLSKLKVVKLRSLFGQLEMETGVSWPLANFPGFFLKVCSGRKGDEGESEKTRDKKGFLEGGLMF